MNKSWNVGLRGYKHHTLTANQFKTSIIENDFENNRTLDAILSDHLRERVNTGVELMYSGGMDSELVLDFCVRNKIPVVAKTIAFKIKDFLVNPADLYYSEKFCRTHDVTHEIHPLDILHFFESGEYLTYCDPYPITEPLSIAYLWLIEQCNSFPVFGGDWPWVEMHHTEKRLSPIRLNSAVIDLYLLDKGISGIGNMLGHSFESSCFFMKRQIHESINDKITLEDLSGVYLKHKMYGPRLEPRLKHYSWSLAMPMLKIQKYKLELKKRAGQLLNKIVWDAKVCEIINSSITENEKQSL